MNILLNILISIFGLFFSLGLSNSIFEIVYGKTYNEYLDRKSKEQLSTKILCERQLKKLGSYQLYNNISTIILWISVVLKYVWKV
jgi:hypothetical protein